MNKYIRKTTLVVVMGILFVVTGCTDFLTRPPITSFTDEDFWISEANTRTFMWGLYNSFYGYGNGSGTTGEFYWQIEGTNSRMMYSDNLLNNSFQSFPANASTTNTWWRDYYIWIRKANLLIERIPNVPNINNATRNHLLGVARFFRAHSYFNLVANFGDVPYIDSYVDPGDDANVWVPRTARATVIENIIADLEFAATNMLASDGKETVNKYAAYAMLARVCLFEGTHRKYHNAGDHNSLLTKAKSAAEAVMNSGLYSLGSTFKEKYNSLSLDGNKEMILYKRYELASLKHSLLAYTNTSTVINGVTKAAVESFLCKDGFPINQSPLYKQDKTFANVMADRDPRLHAIVNQTAYGYADNSLGGLISTTGYLTNLWTNPTQSGADVTNIGQNFTDAPIYTLSEIFLIYAEACAELGAITDADLDKSINLLRTRAGVAPLKVSGTNALIGSTPINDPKRTSTLETQSGGSVSPILWEIRRERRVELMGWVYLRHLDIIRWKKGDYLDTQKNPDSTLGAYVGTAAATASLIVNPDGYILRYPNNTRVYTEKLYLNSIPTEQIILMEAEGVTLTQNPGW